MHRPWDTTAAVWLLGLAIALQTFLENAVSVFTAVQRLEQEFQMRLLEKIVLVTVGFAALGLGVGLLGVAAAFALAPAVSLVFAAWRIHRRVAPLVRWWRPAGRGAWPGSWPRWPRRSFSASPPHVWRLLPWCSSRATRPRGTSGRRSAFTTSRGSCSASLQAAVFPELARTPSALPRFRALTTQAFEALLLVALPITLGLAVGASWLTPRIYGAGYGPTGPVLAVLGAAVACSMLGHLLGVVLLALDRPRRLRTVAALAFVTGLVAIPGLVAARGALGARWAC